MRRRLLVDGRLTVPLYHGSSTAFHRSILETGLGGRNVIEELQVRNAAQKLLEYEGALSVLPKWVVERYFLLKMAEDPAKPLPKSHTGFNYRYGGAYLTPSKEAAIGYAVANRQGSEAITAILNLLDELLERVPEASSEAAFSPILAFARGPREPMLVEATDVPEESLRAEQGGDYRPILEDIEFALDNPEIYDIMTSQSNFELVRAVPAYHLRLYRLIASESGSWLPSNVRLLPI